VVKLKAFTLIESIVSLLLISTVFGASLLLFNQAAVNNYAVQEAKLIADETIRNVEIQVPNFNTDVIRKGDFEVKLQLLDYRELEGIKKLTVQVVKDGKVLYTTQKLIVLDEV
tara:strand:+ start:234 stop:572 length:339 start_codon:yes stop_codon:yes gene_type:complete